MRDYLHGLAEVVAPPLLLEDVLVYLPGGQIVEFAELAVGEALIVAEVEVGFSAVVEHIHLAVLERAHRSRVDVEVGIEFLYPDVEFPGLEKRPERSRRKPLAQRRNYSACNKYVFHFGANFKTRNGPVWQHYSAGLPKKAAPKGRPGVKKTALNRAAVVFVFDRVAGILAAVVYVVLFGVRLVKVVRAHSERLR